MREENKTEHCVSLTRSYLLRCTRYSSRIRTDTCSFVLEKSKRLQAISIGKSRKRKLYQLSTNNEKKRETTKTRHRRLG